MDWLYEAEHGNILIITDAGSGWLELSRTRTEQRKEIDTPLYSPRSNGLAERAVQTFKKA